MSEVLSTPYGMAVFITLLLLPDVAATTALVSKAVKRKTLHEVDFEDCACLLPDQSQKIMPFKDSKYHLAGRGPG
jgi:citrate lyase synthetase